MRKNVNPKSLKGRDQLDRVRELMGKMQPLNENTSLSELELIKKGPNNVIYGVVRENHKYFIKTTNKTSGKKLLLKILTISVDYKINFLKHMILMRQLLNN
jgi:hypothetical protein